MNEAEAELQQIDAELDQVALDQVERPARWAHHLPKLSDAAFRRYIYVGCECDTHALPDELRWSEGRGELTPPGRRALNAELQAREVQCPNCDAGPGEGCTETFRSPNHCVILVVPAHQARRHERAAVVR